MSQNNKLPAKFRLMFFAIVLVITVFLLGAHYGFYKLTIALLEIGGTRFADWYLGMMLLLGVSFPLSSVLVFRSDNLVTRIFYFVSSLWIGCYFHLLLGAIAAMTLSIALPFVGLAALSPAGALVVIGLGLIVAAFAYCNANFPEIKIINVKLKNLPEAWKTRRTVFISDIHLGAILRMSFLERVVGRIKELKPDILLIGGDLFDGGGSDLRALIEPINQLTPEFGCFMVTGNHETYIHHRSAVDAIESTRIRLLQDEIVELDGVQLVGIDYPRPGRNNNPEDVLKKLDRDKPTILLYHEPRRVALFKKYGVNLHLAGHTHRGQIWPFNYVTRLVYKGLDYGLHTDGDFNLYCSCGVGTWGPPFRAGSRSEIVLMRLE